MGHGILDVVDLRDIIGPSGDTTCVMTNCIFDGHVDHNASLAVYADHMYCFGCQTWKGCKDSLLLLTGESTLYAALQAAGYDYLSDEVRPDPNRWVPKPGEPLEPMNDKALGYADRLARDLHKDGSKADYLAYDRMLDTKTIEEEWLGFTGFAYSIPIWNRRHETVLTIRYRLDPVIAAQEPNRPKYWGTRGRNQAMLYGAWWIPDEAQSVVVCEGEFDALLLHQEARYAGDPIHPVALSNGAGQLYKLPGMLKAVFPNLRHIVIATDQDQAGNVGAMDLMVKAEELGWTHRRVRWDMATVGKDVGDYISEYGPSGAHDFVDGEPDLPLKRKHR